VYATFIHFIRTSTFLPQNPIVENQQNSTKVFTPITDNEDKCRKTKTA